ncbi:MAG TPA: hypothetical protein VGN36_00810 [Sphingorhabdus sp.]|jgi:hypothetical protein|nr:hypothetical protein [Sphingorhabdus sp.]
MIDIGGRPVHYTSHAGRMPIRIAGTDEPRARMFYVAYRVSPKPGETRPLTVIWNGGPGGSMLSILLGGQGPKRISDGVVVDNPTTLLDQTDLLYIDAVGSGFSRITAPADSTAFYQTKGDNDAFVECILGWRRQFETEHQPVFLAGVSWGAYRVATVAHALASRGVAVGGGAMMAGRNGLARQGAEQRFLPLGIVHYPRIAMLHGKLPAQMGSDVAKIERDALSWATNTYLPALARIESLSSSEREAIAQQLALLSGLPLGRIDRRTLVVTPRQMTGELLADRGQRLQQFDMRQIARPPVKSSRREVSPGERYLRSELGYNTSLSYLPLVWDAGRVDGFLPTTATPPEWNYLDGYYADALSREDRDRINQAEQAKGYPPGGQEQALAEQAMRIGPAMKMLVIHGRFDALPSSCSSVAAQLAEIDPDIRRRVAFRCVDSGHALFVNDDSVRAIINADLRRLLQGE